LKITLPAFVPTRRARSFPPDNPISKVSGNQKIETARETKASWLRASGL